MTPLIKKNLWVIELLAIALVSYFMAKMATNLVAVKLSAPAKVVSKSPTGAALEENAPALSPQDYDLIVERNIFDALGVSAEETAALETPLPTEEMKPPSGEPVPTSLSIELLSTFSVGDGKDTRSNVNVADRGKDAEVYRVNESFQAGAKIVQILFDRMIFSNNGRLEYVLLNDFAKGEKRPAASERPAVAEAKKEGEPETTAEPSAEESKFTISRAEIDEALGNIDQLFTQIRAVPYTKDGKMSGLKLLSVKGGSIFAKLGLKRGDVLEKINGKEFDIKQGMDLFNSLKNESKIALDLIRRGKSQTLEYEVK